MKIFDEQNAKLIKFNKTFNPDDFRSCVSRAILLIRNREAQMTDEGYKWPIITETCRWRLEQAIINRPANQPMMAAAIEYVETVEHRAENFNGIAE